MPDPGNQQYLKMNTETLPAEKILQLYRWMVLGRTFSERMVALQRQGRMGTFAPSNGQEATCAGLAAPLQADDWLVASYRENLSYVIKGVPLLTLMKQWGGYVADDYPAEAHCLPFQIVLGAQALHAVGIAQAIKMNKRPQVVVAVVGDGATSEGDFNEALNFAGVFQVPLVFVVQNNGWAISTPRSRQTAARNIADRGPGFGIPGQVVDGNDVEAVYSAVTAAVENARAGQGPSLIEAVTYRLGAHTTADDPRKYRAEKDVAQWQEEDPIPKLRKALLAKRVLTEIEDKRLQKEAAVNVEAAVQAYEALPAQSPEMLFKLVYASPTPQLQRQQEALLGNWYQLRRNEEQVVEPEAEAIAA